MKTLKESYVSSCCFDATRLAPGKKRILTCKACGDPCTLVLKPCPLGLCDGSGEVAHFESDDTGSYRAGTEDCLCRK